MTPTSMMLYGGIAAVVGFLIAGFNMIRMMGNHRKMGGGSFMVHLLFGGIMSVGGLCAIGGFIWFLVDKYAG